MLAGGRLVLVVGGGVVTGANGAGVDGLDGLAVVFELSVVVEVVEFDTVSVVVEVVPDVWVVVSV